MLPGSISHQVSVVRGGRVGHGPNKKVVAETSKNVTTVPGASTVEMTEIVSQHLQLVSSELVVVPEHLVVARPAGPLDTLVRQKVEVPLSRVVDTLVHHGASQGVAIPVLVIVGGEKPEIIGFRVTKIIDNISNLV